MCARISAELRGPSKDRAAASDATFLRADSWPCSASLGACIVAPLSEGMVEPHEGYRVVWSDAGGWLAVRVLLPGWQFSDKGMILSAWVDGTPLAVGDVGRLLTAWSRLKLREFPDQLPSVPKKASINIAI